MDKMSILSIILVSFPEELLLVTITLAAAGYKDVLNLRVRKNLAKLLLTAAVMTITTVSIRSLLPYFSYTAAVTLTLMFFIIVIAYRFKPISCFLGYLLSVLILTAGDMIVLGIGMSLLQIPLETLYSSDFLRIIFSLPTRFLQIISIILIIRMKNLKLSFVRLRFDEYIQVILFLLMIFSSVYTVERGFGNLKNDFGTILNLIVNTVILVIFSAWMIVKIFMIRKRNLINKKVHDIELNRIKKLLEQGHTNRVIELIDLSLNSKSEEAS